MRIFITYWTIRKLGTVWTNYHVCGLLFHTLLVISSLVNFISLRLQTMVNFVLILLIIHSYSRYAMTDWISYITEFSNVQIYFNPILLGGVQSARTFFSVRLLIFSNSNDTFKVLDFSYFVINWLLKKKLTESEHSRRNGGDLKIAPLDFP